MEYKIIKLNHGWYNFEEIPQGYIKIANLCCGSDRKAINQAKRMIGPRDTVKIVKDEER